MTRTAARELAVQLCFRLSVKGELSAQALDSFFEEEYYASLAGEGENFTQLPDENPAPWPGNAPVIVLNADLEMSTGKAAAQAAHALLSWYLQLETGARLAWRDAGEPAGVRLAAGQEFTETAARPGAGPLIVDAGMTEIAPDTATAFVESASFSPAPGVPV